jgi:opacity protein-like surface antigen
LVNQKLFFRICFDSKLLNGAQMKQTAKVGILAFAIFTGLGGTALAAAPSSTGIYVSGSVGLGLPGKWDESNWGVDKADSGVPFSGAAGYNFGSTRLEAAAGYQKYDWKSGTDNAAVTTVMGNAFYDFDTASDFRPYVMGGLGIADVNVSWASNNSTAFAWQLGAGVGVKVGKGWTLDVGYRYLKPSGLQCPSDDNDVSWPIHNILAGLRYQF